ncbi:hypothetical protein BDY19DRAFT_96181 [Irpex rosettiformis]|uniref:Uncharacterized protein n=1 Tax=Irpex rosettiformis TaxID=378272 RepID=A0ACB8U703_9APHY|nr:hypothetical protein BDY19DRAFT_96181 [Irpex rosettiformis]
MIGTLLGYLTGNFGKLFYYHLQGLAVYLGLSAWIAIVFVQIILHIWLYAIYNRSCYRRFLIPLSVICVVLASLVCGFSTNFGTSIHFVVYDPLCVSVSISGGSNWPPTSSELNSLIYSKFPAFITGIIMAWDMMTVLFLGLIALRVTYTYMQHDRCPEGLAYILTRDSLLYCFATALVTVLNLFSIVSVPYAMYTIGCGFTATIPNVLSNRIFINLRAWERYREERIDVGGVSVDRWETMFHITC